MWNKNQTKQIRRYNFIKTCSFITRGFEVKFWILINAVKHIKFAIGKFTFTLWTDFNKQKDIFQTNYLISIKVFFIKLKNKLRILFKREIQLQLITENKCTTFFQNVFVYVIRLEMS